MSSVPPIQVACLCAGWCRLCDSYREVFDPVLAEFARQHPGMQTHWIDIEDQAELVGDLDIETFPTLAIIDGGQLRFAGPLTPQPETLRRLMRSTLEETSAAAARSSAPAPEWAAFVQRLLGR